MGFGRENRSVEQRIKVTKAANCEDDAEMSERKWWMKRKTKEEAEEERLRLA